MTYPELQIQLNLNPDSRVNILRNIDICRWTRYGYLFIDQEDGQCYLFDKYGNLDDINKVKSIEYRAFYNCRSLTNINISDSVMSIGYGAFAYCESLTSIKIPSSVEWIGNWAFECCTSLTNIEIPDSVKSIRYCAFYGCASLKELVFKNMTIDQVKVMYNYPWGIEYESIIKVES